MPRGPEKASQTTLMQSKKRSRPYAPLFIWNLFFPHLPQLLLTYLLLESAFFSPSMLHFLIISTLIWNCPPGPGLQLLSFCCKPSIVWLWNHAPALTRGTTPFQFSSTSHHHPGTGWGSTAHSKAQHIEASHLGLT